MQSKSVRLIVFLGVCILLVGVIFFKNHGGVGDKFAQANALMSRLQSSALYTDTLSDADLALLKTTREESQDRITLLTTTITSDVSRAKGMIAEVSLQTAIIDNFTLKAQRSYFTEHIDEKLGILSTNTELKTLLDSINRQVIDKNIRQNFIAWYDEFFATVCSTTDPTNDITVKGTVTFQNGSPASVDTCQGATLVQTQCVNKQNIGTTQTNCQNGCSDGVCLNAPVNTFKGFTITMLDQVAVNTATGLTVAAIKNDNSVDTSYSKQVVILVDGDPNATLPLTAQRLNNGTLTLDNALKFKKVGNVTVTVKDLETGTESSKNIIVTDGTSGTTTTGTTTGSTTTGSTTTTTGSTASGTADSNNTTSSTTTGTTTGSTTSDTTSSTTGGSTTSGSTTATTTTGTTTGNNGTTGTTSGSTNSTGTTTTGTTSGSTTASTGSNTTSTTTGSTSGTAQTVVTCPTYTAPPADFCAGGNRVGGGTNAAGCPVAPTCEPKVTTGAVSINEMGKYCWFGDATRRITLGEFLSYQANTGTNSGLIYLDEIGLYGTSTPAVNEGFTDLLGYQESSWSSENNLTVTNSTQLTNYFVFRTNSDGVRTWNIPTNGIKFYGCFTFGDRPTVW